MDFFGINGYLLPFFTACAVGICADTVLCLAPGESGKSLAKYAKLVITLCMILTLLTPLSKCSNQNLPEALPEFSSPSETPENYSENSDFFAKNLEKSIKKELENKIKSLISEKFGIIAQEISIQLTEQATENGKNLAISEVFVSFSPVSNGDFPLEQLKQYISAITNCEIPQIHLQSNPDV